LRLIGASLLLAGCAATVSGADRSEMLPVPGGTRALAVTLHIDPIPDRARFAAELARLVYQPADGLATGARSRPAALAQYFDALQRFRDALAALEPTGATLSAAADGRTRDRLATLLDVIGLRLRQNRGRYLVEPNNDADGHARGLLLQPAGIDAQDIAAQLNAGRTLQITVAADTVPVPLSAERWTAMAGKHVTADRLFEAIMRDEGLAQLCHGLAGLDDETLQYVSDHPKLLAQLKDDASTFGAFAGHFHIRDNQVIPVGGAAGRTAWEAALGEPTTEPERFARALFGGEGRHAYLYDLVAELDEPHAAFVLGSWISDPERRIARFKALINEVTSAFPEWKTRQRPFKRPPNGFNLLFMNVSVLPDGTPAFPAMQRFWELVFEGNSLSDVEATELRNIGKDGVVDAAWLAEAIAATPVRERRLRQIAFAFRVFRGADDASTATAVIAVRALPLYPSLLLTLERAGVTKPAVYAAAARRAQRLAELEGARAYVALSQFQGALALIARLHAVGAADRAQTDVFTSGLVALDLKNGSYGGAVAEWIRTTMLPAVEPATAEDLVLAALAGVSAAAMPSPSVSWEGDRYRMDLAAAELSALKRARAGQRAYTLGTALSIHAVARQLSAGPLELAGVQATAKALVDLRADLPARDKDPSHDGAALVARTLADPRDVIADAIKDLQKITTPKDVRRASRWAWPLAEVTDVVLADVLSSLAYTVALAPVSDAPMFKDAARRHDFGLAAKDGATRVATEWSLPKSTSLPGVPWHVTGSLLGMDVAVAPRVLRRVSAGAPPAAPALITSESATFELSIAFLNPFQLTDQDRDAIKQAVDRGRRRIETVQPADVSALAHDINMDGWRQRALAWDLEHEPSESGSLFSLTELLVLGGGHPAALNAWGMSMTALNGCLCTRLMTPNGWRLVLGEPQLGGLATAVPDLHLRVALALAEWQMPAALARLALSAATQDFLETVRLADSNDWLALVRTAQRVPADRIEDYLAAATVAGGPLVHEAAGQTAGR